MEFEDDIPLEVQSFFRQLYDQLTRKFDIEDPDSVVSNGNYYEMDVRAYDLFDSRAGVEDDDHPDVNQKNANQVVKMAKSIMSRNKELKGYKFELGPEEKFWMTMSLRK